MTSGLKKKAMLCVCKRRATGVDVNEMDTSFLMVDTLNERLLWRSQIVNLHDRVQSKADLRYFAEYVRCWPKPAIHQISMNAR